MRILVLSDSHGRWRNIDKVLQAHPEADVVIHLGDGADDLEYAMAEYDNIKFYQVAGNCDRMYDLPLTETVYCEGKKIIITHGHEFRVKYTADLLIDYALNENAVIALYGHTHRQESRYEDGLYIMNPGAMMNGYYGMIDITKAGIVLVEASL